MWGPEGGGGYLKFKKKRNISNKFIAIIFVKCPIPRSTIKIKKKNRNKQIILLKKLYLKLES
jgi:hypothetical protein